MIFYIHQSQCGPRFAGGITHIEYNGTDKAVIMTYLIYVFKIFDLKFSKYSHANGNQHVT